MPTSVINNTKMELVDVNSSNNDVIFNDETTKDVWSAAKPVHQNGVDTGDDVVQILTTEPPTTKNAALNKPNRAPMQFPNQMSPPSSPKKFPNKLEPLPNKYPAKLPPLQSKLPPLPSKLPPMPAKF